MQEKSILIVEDEAIVADDIRQTLINLGYTVAGTAKSGEIALEKIKELRPDLVLMDIHLATQMDGVETAGKIHELYDIPVIYLTAHSDKGFLDRAKVTEPYGYILKPFDKRELHSAIEIALYKHRMEERAKEYEARFRAIYEGSNDAIMLLNETGFFDCNPHTLQMFGVKTKEDFCRFHPADISPPSQPGGRESLLAADEHIHAAFRNGFDRFEWIFRRTNGEDFPAEVLMSAFDWGEERALQATVRDITERKHMEEYMVESLRQSQQIIQSILDTIPMRVFWKDRDLKYLGCNRPFAQDAGFNEPKELIGRDDYAMGWRDQAEIYRADDRSVIASGTAKVMIEEPQKTPDGRIIWLLTSKVPLRDATGEISGVLGTYMDISEYRNAKEAIRESEEKYRAFFATSKDCVFITSKDGRFVDFNDEAPAFFGYRDREEFGTVNVQDLYCNASERQEHIRAIEQSGFVKDYAVDLRKKDGSTIHALITSIARKDISGKVIGFQGTVKDITEQRRVEEALKESNERYLSYIKEAAMRLKTPVEVVEQNITTLIGDIKTGDAEEEQILLQLQLQVKNIEQIRQNILNLNKTIVDGYGEISPASKQFLTE